MRNLEVCVAFDILVRSYSALLTSEQLRGDRQRVDRRRVVGYEAPFIGALVDVPVGSSVDNKNLATAKCLCVICAHLLLQSLTT